MICHERAGAGSEAGQPSEPLLDSVSHAVGVAQLVELLVVVQAVGGSSPLAHLRELPANRHFSGSEGITDPGGVHQLSTNFLTPVQLCGSKGLVG